MPNISFSIHLSQSDSALVAFPHLLIAILVKSDQVLDIDPLRVRQIFASFEIYVGIASI